jgi:sporulation protein YlmC with PRC-barrel domain
MKIRNVRSTPCASVTALTLGLAFVASASAQAPSYPIGQGPFGQPQQTPGQSQPPSPPAAPGQAQTPPGWGQAQAAPIGGGAKLHVVSSEAEAFRLQSFSGKPVRGSGQEALGSVSDFLIDPQTGELHFAVVPSGAGGAGETYRLVPVAALDPTSGPEGLRISVGKAQWDQVGTMTEERLQGNVSISDDQRQRLQQQFALSQPLGGSSSGLLRASQLRGKMLQSGAQQLGNIEDVAVDVRHRVAAVMVVPTGTPPVSGQKFLVPFGQLQISGADQATINTTLTQMHFQQAQSATPTGYTGSPFTSANPPATAAAVAVRQALDQDQSLAKANVQVIPENRIALRGTVESEQLRSNIERTAKEAAPGVQVDNHITVQGANP